jgi:hypothetical protein
VCSSALALSLAAQDVPQAAGSDAPAIAAPEPVSEPIDKRVFGVLPNYRTANLGDTFHPLTVKQKFYIGYKDSTDYPAYLLGGVFAGLAQLSDQHPSYGQGFEGYAKRWGAATADQVIGNFMAESILPSLFHQDPRFFRKGEGSKKSRIGYAATRIFVAKSDKGDWGFNYSEVAGNAITAGIANLYYPGERSVSDNFQRLYVQLATDAVSQILKEFWPDVKRKYWFHRKTTSSPPAELAAH